MVQHATDGSAMQRRAQETKEPGYVTYIRDNWEGKLSLWVKGALAGIDHSNAFTNAHIESYHNVLKAFDLKGKKRLQGRRLDSLVADLLTTVVSRYRCVARVAHHAGYEVSYLNASFMCSFMCARAGTDFTGKKFTSLPLRSHTPRSFTTVPLLQVPSIYAAARSAGSSDGGSAREGSSSRSGSSSGSGSGDSSRAFPAGSRSCTSAADRPACRGHRGPKRPSVGGCAGSQLRQAAVGVPGREAAPRQRRRPRGACSVR